MDANKKWWNNGINNKRCAESPGDDWVEGRLTFKRMSPTKETRRKQSISNKGQKAWNKGLKNWHSEETKQKMSDAAKARVARGILPDNTGNIPWNRSSDVPAFKRYQRDVRALSEKKYTMHKDIINPDNLRRGRYNYHLDHITPIKHGFENGIPVEDIAAEDNLQILHWRDNLSKGSCLTEIMASSEWK